MDTQLYTSIDLVPAMSEIELYIRGRFFKQVSQEETYDIAKEYVAHWQKQLMGLYEWLETNTDFLMSFGRQVEHKKHVRG